ncbi:MAG: hypothetical protein MN733_35070 [Nitrososphaera sp.]|nr:hypothetical protein [Nitrososphaera sp.]
MSSEKIVEAAELIGRLFSVVAEEMRTRPAFAEKVINALPKGVVVKIEMPSPSKKATVKYDPNAFSLVKVLRTEGEEELRARLKKVRMKASLRQMAEAQHIDIAPAVYNKTLADITEHIIQAAKDFIEDRMAAAS